MAVPDFQSMFVPLLKVVSDGRNHTTKEIVEALVEHFQLSNEDREEMLPSRNQRRLNNRVGWARTHLKNALLIDYVGRGVVKITPRGLKLLATNPESISLRDLDEKYPEHLAWLNKKGPKPTPINGGTSSETPDEQIARLTNS